VTGEFVGEEIAQRAVERLGEMGAEEARVDAGLTVTETERDELRRLAKLGETSSDLLSGVDAEGQYVLWNSTNTDRKITTRSCAAPASISEVAV
jgi:hypothetical protein